MQIEYKIRFEDGGVTITQAVEPSQSRASKSPAASARPGRQLASTLVETRQLDRLAVGRVQGRGGSPNDQGLGGSPNDQGLGGSPNDQGVGGGPSDQGRGGGPSDQGRGGGPNDPAGGRGGGSTISYGGHAAGGSGKVSAVVLGPLVITGF